MARGIEWDAAKALLNHAKHGIRFSDVEPVFFDPYALSMPDPLAFGEERFVASGMDALGRILTVVYAYRGNRIRVISARLATRSERREYERGI